MTSSPWWFTLALVVLLSVYLLHTYGHAFRLAFVNDDYLFLEKVRHAPLWRLWLPKDLIFDWYRPWSRETHYWILHHLAGLDESIFHGASFALALGVLLTYFLLARSLVGPGAAAVATGAVASLSLWSTPVMWVAGAQDLWMLLFGLLFLQAVVVDRAWLAYVPLSLSLVSKETAAILPAIASAFVWIVRGRPLRSSIARTSGFWAVTGLWAFLHPTLRGRLLGSVGHTIETEHRPSAAFLLLKTVLAQANLQGGFAPEAGWMHVVLRGAIGGLILGTIVWLGGHLGTGGSASGEDSRRGGRVIVFGLVWAALGFAILLLPSIGWHAYYGALGSLGLWLSVSCWLARRPRTAMAVVLVMAFTCEGRAATPSWDWGADWYQVRAGSILARIRVRLRGLHPSLPSHSRLYFVRLPNNIGLLAGNGPAIRIWYDDPTLEGHFYSAYTPREVSAVTGGDYFFRFDTMETLVEVHAGPEPLSESLHADPAWQHDHDVLAALFIRAGNAAGAAQEYAKLARLVPDRPDYALYAGAAHAVTGERAQADSFFRVAARAYGDSAVRRRAEELIRAVPRAMP